MNPLANTKRKRLRAFERMGLVLRANVRHARRNRDFLEAVLFGAPSEAYKGRFEQLTRDLISAEDKLTAWLYRRQRYHR